MPLINEEPKGVSSSPFATLRALLSLIRIIDRSKKSVTGSRCQHWPNQKLCRWYHVTPYLKSVMSFDLIEYTGNGIGSFYQTAASLHLQHHFPLFHYCQLFIVLRGNYARFSNSMVLFLLLYSLAYIIILAQSIFPTPFFSNKFLFHKNYKFLSLKDRDHVSY